MRDVTDEGRGNTVEGLAAEAAEDGDDWSNLKPADKGDELQDLTIRLEEYLVGHKEQLDVILEGKNVKVNPYELAVKELNDPAATVESRKTMLSRIEKLLNNLEKAS
jgi:hypothetical protein